MAKAILTSGLTKAYGPKLAVDKLTIDVAAGEVFAFLGPNGAGKTTTIRMLLALQRPSGGSASVLGFDSQRQSVEVHRSVGYLPGELVLHPRLTGRRHIDLFGRARGLTDLTYAGELLERLGAVTDRPVRELSKGNRQKIGLVLALMARPQLLVLDEPTTGLDPLMQVEFEALVRETVAEGRTVFLSSHELGEVQRLADRVAIIKDGKLLAVDTVAGLERAAPRRMEVRFRSPVPRSAFERLGGVRIVSCEGPAVTLELDGDIGPTLRAVADHDPLDVVSRHADLDELFLDFYRGHRDREASRAR